MTNPLPKLKNHWTTTLAVIICTGLILYAYACHSTVQSILHPDQQVTRPVLQAEIDYLLDIGKARFAELDEKDAWKKAFYDQFMVASNGGTPNPAGIIGLLFAIGGVTALINNVKLRLSIRNGTNKKTTETNPPAPQPG